MTQIFDKDGNLIPVTLVEAGPCRILEVAENPTKVKIGFGAIKESKVNKPLTGYFKKVGFAPMRTVKEFESSDNKNYTVGQELKADVFKAGDFVDVSGISIGKGFQGGMKRWGWEGGPAAHGSMHHRRVGSIGSSADPSRTFRGRHMPGHMGHVRSTSQGLRIMEVDVEKNLVLIKGAVPGHKNSLVEVRISKKKAWKDLYQEKAIIKKKVNPMKQSKAKAGTASKKKG